MKHDILDRIDRDLLDASLARNQARLADMAAAPSIWGAGLGRAPFGVNRRTDPTWFSQHSPDCECCNDPFDSMARADWHPFTALAEADLTIDCNLDHFPDLYPDGLYGCAR